MDGLIHYINTDICLTSGADLKLLLLAFKAGGLRPLSEVTIGDDGQGYIVLETVERHTEPESNIAAMLAVIESFGEELQAVWKGCSRREFDIGYDCGAEPWSFNQGLSSQLLGRMAEAGASLRITIYPDRGPVKPNRKTGRKKRENDPTKG